MRLHRFYLSSNIDKDKINTFSSAALVHQLRSVFRFQEGAELIFFDGTGTDYVSQIVSLSKDDLSFRVIETRPVKRFARLDLALAFSLIKKDHAEWIIEKCTELGISEIVPLVSERSEKKGLNMERARKIIVEACEQSGRAEIPAIHEPQSLEAYLAAAEGKAIAFHTEGFPFDRSALPREGKLVAFVGPEGGWSPKEVELFASHGVPLIRLDAPVLRAETAAIAVASALLI